MKKIKTYVINLPKDVARRQNMEKVTGQIPCLDVEWVQAVYGKELPEEEIERRFDRKKYQTVYRRLLFPGEIGCTLSHYECYKRIVRSKEQAALILEDDVDFVQDTCLETLLQKSKDFMNRDEPLVILLHGAFSYTGKPVRFYDRYSLYRIYDAMFTTGYFINQSAARLILQEACPFQVADDWFYYRRRGIRIFSFYPSVAIQLWDVFESSLKESERSKGRIRIPRSVFEFKLSCAKILALILNKFGVVRQLGK